MDLRSTLHYRGLALAPVAYKKHYFQKYVAQNKKVIDLEWLAQ